MMGVLPTAGGMTTAANFVSLDGAKVRTVASVLLKALGRDDAAASGMNALVLGSHETIF
jgi:hypothetical protein